LKNNKTTENPDAVFIGWQENYFGTHFALYTISAIDHPSYLSTVSEKTLTKMNLRFLKQPYVTNDPAH
jgi:hypothetical protein